MALALVALAFILGIVLIVCVFTFNPVAPERMHDPHLVRGSFSGHSKTSNT